MNHPHLRLATLDGGAHELRAPCPAPGPTSSRVARASVAGAAGWAPAILARGAGTTLALSSDAFGATTAADGTIKRTAPP